MAAEPAAAAILVAVLIRRSSASMSKETASACRAGVCLSAAPRLRFAGCVAGFQLLNSVCGRKTAAAAVAAVEVVSSMVRVWPTSTDMGPFEKNQGTLGSVVCRCSEFDILSRGFPAPKKTTSFPLLEDELWAWLLLLTQKQR